MNSKKLALMFLAKALLIVIFDASLLKRIWRLL